MTELFPAKVGDVRQQRENKRVDRPRAQPVEWNSVVAPLGPHKELNDLPEICAREIRREERRRILIVGYPNEALHPVPDLLAYRL